MSGPLGPFGSEAVVMTGIFRSVANLVSITVLARSSATLMVESVLRFVVNQVKKSIGDPRCGH